MRTKRGKEFPKKGKTFPFGTSAQLPPYAETIARALKQELAISKASAKTLMRWTGAGERTVKNWLKGANGPSGQHLMALMKHSDLVYSAVHNLVRPDGQELRSRLREVKSVLGHTLALMADI